MRINVHSNGCYKSRKKLKSKDMKKEKGYKIQGQILRIVPESCIWIIEVPEETEANNQKWEQNKQQKKPL